MSTVSPVKQEKKKVSTYCYQCVNGPDLLTVEVVDGVATKVEPNFDLRGEHPADGKVCVKPFGLVQKLYNPHRVLKPMKRTNPKKGKHEEPGWVEISWDEALDTLADRLNDIKDRGLLDENGNARLAYTTGGAATPYKYMGSFPAYLAAWGPIDQGLGAGGTVKCSHTEHMFSELWHRAFVIVSDTPHCDYIVSFGNNFDVSSGVTGVRRHADARKRGLKRIQFEPILSVTGANATKWIPIKTKTDNAVLYAMLHYLLHETALEKLDVPFLKNNTASPYLVGPNGYYLRDPVTKEPLLWDERSKTVVSHDTRDTDPALEGPFVVDNAIELGADDEKWSHSNIEADTAFDMLKKHMASHTPEWAAEISQVPAETIREVTQEFLEHARVGETIEIDGVTLPHRPVCISFGRSTNNGWGAFENIWARAVMQTLLGALEVPGSMVGSATHIAGDTDWDRMLTVEPGEDGFMYHTFTPTSKEEWDMTPFSRHAHNSLTPMVGTTIGQQLMGSTDMAWLRLQGRAADSWPRPNPPDVWITYKCSPVISFTEVSKVGEVIEKFPFMASFTYTLDETNHYADVLLPEAGDLESDQLLRIGGASYWENHWESEGWGLRQAVIPPRGEAKDFSWIANELARRTNMLEDYNNAINFGVCGVPLKTEEYDYALDPGKEHDQETIWNAVCKAASWELTEGKEVNDLDWFREHGYKTRPMSKLKWYLHPAMQEKGLRYELPYQERYTRMGMQLANRLHEMDVMWWEKQLKEYEPLPSWHDVNKIWEDMLEDNFDVKASDYPFWLLAGRSMQYSWGANVGIQMMDEVSENVYGHDGVMMNADKAAEMGISEGDTIEVTSPVGSTRGKARLRQGIHPDVIMVLATFGQWKMPYAKDLKRPSVNDVVPMNEDSIDGTGSGIHNTKVNITRIGTA